MPHDSRGDPLREGDEVTMRLRVASVSQGDTACNVVLEVIDVAGTDEYLPTISCNSRLTTRAGAGVGAGVGAPVPELAAHGPPER